MSEHVIAIDGPAASGKSTVAARVARHFRIPYVNTGNLFRAVTYAALQKCDDLEQLSEEQWQDLLAHTLLEYQPLENGDFVLLLNGSEPGEALRTARVAHEVSLVAAQRSVRDFVLNTERKLADGGWVVMEGRDIGTVVFPHARYKFFVSASPLERARRRLAQSGEVVDGATLESVAAEIARRDHLDSTRAVAPLKAAEDAVKIDTTSLSIDAVVQQLIMQVSENGLA